MINTTNLTYNYNSRRLSTPIQNLVTSIILFVFLCCVSWQDSCRYRLPDAWNRFVESGNWSEDHNLFQAINFVGYMYYINVLFLFTCFFLHQHQNFYHNPWHVPKPPKMKAHRYHECNCKFDLAIHDPEFRHQETTLGLKIVLVCRESRARTDKRQCPVRSYDSPLLFHTTLIMWSE